MIPVKLYLHNFMGYKTPQLLDFGDIHVACLTGDNGAGKSSLLDAITWVLWGKARTRLDDDLIHLGETEMEVEYTFTLGQETYRVLRRRTSVKRGKSELHFHIADAGDWRTLTEDSIRLTQAKVSRLIRLDYDTFINSAFLLQGRADEFTTRKATERKQILGDILGLGIYDEYEQKAGEKVRFYREEIRILESQIAQMEREMGNEATYQAEWQKSQHEAATLKKSRHDAEIKLDELRQQHKELDLKQRLLADLKARLSQAQADIADLQKTTTEIKAKIVDYQTMIAKQDEINAGYQDLQNAQKAQEDWQERLAQSSVLSNQKHALETKINQAKAKLDADIKVKQAQLDELRPKVRAIPNIEQALHKHQRELADLQALEVKREENRQALNDLNTEAARLGEENKQLKGEMNKIKARLTQLEAAGSTCPICTQPLNETHRAQVKAQFTNEGTAKGDAYRANSNRTKEIKAEQKAIEDTLKKSDQALRKLGSLQAQCARVEQQLQEAQAASQTLATLEDELKQVQSQLDAGEFETEAAAELLQVQAKLTELGYDSEAHKAIRTQLTKLAHFADDLRHLEDAQTRLGEAQTRLEKEEARLKRQAEQTALDEEKVSELTEETKDLPQVARDLNATSNQVNALQRQERLARDAVAAARQKLDHLAYLAKERGNTEDKLAALKETQGHYKTLRAAFGKKGVQALLIEHAIPELENEANNTLAQMTDGRVNLRFITQRAAKSNENIIETLDIRIADELGTRNYELYSGGEAFRVNFAIRIALSKLLARRAGANLQTLIIDEGFGTQDAQGRERLVEAIKIIQSNFEKIIVITHIDELKDVFPIRIHVEKTEDGSQIKIT